MLEQHQKKGGGGDMEVDEEDAGGASHDAKGIDGAKFVGSKIYRYFETGPVAGKVTGFADGLWHVQHDDGDEEDLEYEELLEALSAKAPKDLGGDDGSSAGGTAREDRRPKSLAEDFLERCKLGLPRLGQRKKKGRRYKAKKSSKGSSSSSSSSSSIDLGLDFIEGAVPSHEWPERVDECLLPMSDLELHRLCVRDYGGQPDQPEQNGEAQPSQPSVPSSDLSMVQLPPPPQQQQQTQQEQQQTQQHHHGPLWSQRLPLGVFKDSAKTAMLHEMLPRLIKNEGMSPSTLTTLSTQSTLLHSLYYLHCVYCVYTLYCLHCVYALYLQIR
jgi:hypothetical protein